MPRAREPVRNRLFDSATLLFAEKGFDSVSVREICMHARTSINMIHHYFGSKEGLLNAVVETFTMKVFALPIRIIQREPKSESDFLSRMELYFEQTLDALIEQRLLLRVLMRHDIDADAMTELIGKFVDFLERSQAKGFVRTELDCLMISGCLMDRMVTQVLFAPDIKRHTDHDLLGDPVYRERWCRANLDLFLHGITA